MHLEFIYRDFRLDDKVGPGGRKEVEIGYLPPSAMLSTVRKETALRHCCLAAVGK